MGEKKRILLFTRHELSTYRLYVNAGYGYRVNRRVKVASVEFGSEALVVATTTTRLDGNLIRTAANPGKSLCRVAVQFHGPAEFLLAAAQNGTLLSGWVRPGAVF